MKKWPKFKWSSNNVSRLNPQGPTRGGKSRRFTPDLRFSCRPEKFAMTLFFFFLLLHPSPPRESWFSLCWPLQHCVHYKYSRRIINKIAPTIIKSPRSTFVYICTLGQQLPLLNYIIYRLIPSIRLKNKVDIYIKCNALYTRWGENVGGYILCVKGYVIHLLCFFFFFYAWV